MANFDQIRQLITNGETANAIQTLTSQLKQDGNLPAGLHVLRVIEAGFARVRKKEISGVLSFSEAQQEYNKVNDALVGLLEDLEAGRNPVQRMPDPGRRQMQLYWIIGIAIVLLLGLIAGILLGGSDKAEGNEAPAPCPTFAKSEIPILIIPFQNLGSEVSKPELVLQTRIRDLTEQNKMSSDVQLFKGEQFKESTPGNREALKVGMDCMAQMVIWGQYERVAEGISLYVRYGFTNDANLPPGKFSETLSNLSQLRSDSTRFNSLEDAIFSLCTVLAVHEGRTALAEKWVKKVASPGMVEKKLMEAMDDPGN
ncbi:MAG: hypothetical protein R2778_00310 [Saprospiraceae bacterium]